MSDMSIQHNGDSSANANGNGNHPDSIVPDNETEVCTFG